MYSSPKPAARSAGYGVSVMRNAGTSIRLPCYGILPRLDWMVKLRHAMRLGLDGGFDGFQKLGCNDAEGL
jgi:hypothetical protein